MNRHRRGTLSGLIPARAGNTDESEDGRAAFRAHPRSRGEHDPFQPSGDHRPGSSPLARGTRTSPLLFSIAAGLIPARAGNTISQADAMDAVRAHPRSRGEHPRKKVSVASKWGSSPLARGTRW